jgi:WD40 repeat protein
MRSRGAATPLPPRKPPGSRRRNPGVTIYIAPSLVGPPQVWDVATRKLKLELPGHADEVFCVDWSPDGASVASGSKDRLLRLWRQ